MGAASSVRLVYKEAVQWFKQYIDAETYMEDFRVMDKDEDGGVGYGDLKKWIENKIATEGGSWAIFKLNVPVLMNAHKMSSGTFEAKDSQATLGKVVTVAEFRNLLINLFAISILWVHFDHANTWGEDHDVGSKQLDKEQFTRACLTLSASHAHEQLSPEQIDEDFAMLDVHGNGTVGFMDVCKFCSKYLHETDAPSVVENVPKFFGDVKGPVVEVMKDLNDGPKLYFEAAGVEEKNTRAIDAIAAVVEENIKIAESLTIDGFAEATTENEEKMGSPKKVDSARGDGPRSARGDGPRSARGEAPRSARPDVVIAKSPRPEGGVTSPRIAIEAPLTPSKRSFEESKMEESKMEESKMEESKMEESKMEESKVEETKFDSPRNTLSPRVAVNASPRPGGTPRAATPREGFSPKSAASPRNKVSSPLMQQKSGLSSPVHETLTETAMEA